MYKRLTTQFILKITLKEGHLIMQYIEQYKSISTESYRVINHNKFNTLIMKLAPQAIVKLPNC